MYIKLTVAVGLALCLFNYSEASDVDCGCFEDQNYLILDCEGPRRLPITRICPESKLPEFRVILGSSWNYLDSSDVRLIVKIGQLNHSLSSLVTVLNITSKASATIRDNLFAALEDSDVREFVLKGFNITSLSAYSLAGLPPELKAITITQSAVRDIGEDVFKHFKKLISIDLSYNNIDSLPTYFYTDVLGKLETLGLAGNFIRQIDFKDFFQLKFTQLELDLSNNYLIVQDTINNIVEHTTDTQHIKLKISNNCFCCNNKDQSKVSPQVQLVEYNWRSCKSLSECAAGTEQASSSASEHSYCYFVAQPKPSKPKKLSDLNICLITGLVICGAFLVVKVLTFLRKKCICSRGYNRMHDEEVDEKVGEINPPSNSNRGSAIPHPSGPGGSQQSDSDRGSAIPHPSGPEGSQRSDSDRGSAIPHPSGPEGSQQSDSDRGSARTHLRDIREHRRSQPDRDSVSAGTRMIRTGESRHRPDTSLSINGRAVMYEATSTTSSASSSTDRRSTGGMQPSNVNEDIPSLDLTSSSNRSYARTRSSEQPAGHGPFATLGLDRRRCANDLWFVGSTNTIQTDSTNRSEQAQNRASVSRNPRDTRRCQQSYTNSDSDSSDLSVFRGPPWSLEDTSSVPTDTERSDLSNTVRSATSDSSGTEERQDPDNDENFSSS